jgi:hypothetical protein
MRVCQGWCGVWCRWSATAVVEEWVFDRIAMRSRPRLLYAERARLLPVTLAAARLRLVTCHSENPAEHLHPCASGSLFKQTQAVPTIDWL